MFSLIEPDLPAAELVQHCTQDPVCIFNLILAIFIDFIKVNPFLILNDPRVQKLPKRLDLYLLQQNIRQLQQI